MRHALRTICSKTRCRRRLARRHRLGRRGRLLLGDADGGTLRHQLADHAERARLARRQSLPHRHGLRPRRLPGGAQLLPLEGLLEHLGLPIARSVLGLDAAIEEPGLLLTGGSEKGIEGERLALTEGTVALRQGLAVVEPTLLLAPAATVLAERIALLDRLVGESRRRRRRVGGRRRTQTVGERASAADALFLLHRGHPHETSDELATPLEDCVW